MLRFVHLRYDLPAPLGDLLLLNCLTFVALPGALLRYPLHLRLPRIRYARLRLFPLVVAHVTVTVVGLYLRLIPDGYLFVFRLHSRPVAVDSPRLRTPDGYWLIYIPLHVAVVTVACTTPFTIAGRLLPRLFTFAPYRAFTHTYLPVADDGLPVVPVTDYTTLHIAPFPDSPAWLRAWLVYTWLVTLIYVDSRVYLVGRLYTVADEPSSHHTRCILALFTDPVTLHYLLTYCRTQLPVAFPTSLAVVVIANYGCGCRLDVGWLRFTGVTPRVTLVGRNYCWWTYLPAIWWLPRVGLRLHTRLRTTPHTRLRTFTHVAGYAGGYRLLCGLRLFTTPRWLITRIPARLVTFADPITGRVTGCYSPFGGYPTALDGWIGFGCVAIAGAVIPVAGCCGWFDVYYHLWTRSPIYRFRCSRTRLTFITARCAHTPVDCGLVCVDSPVVPHVCYDLYLTGYVTRCGDLRLRLHSCPHLLRTRPLCVPVERSDYVDCIGLFIRSVVIVVILLPAGI